MKEYIEREAVLRIIDKYGCGSGSVLGYHSGAVDCAGSEIARIPTADVAEVRHAKWVWNENAMDWGLGGWVCSECQAKNDNIPEKPDIHPSAWRGSHYCPNCGAKMDKEE